MSEVETASNGCSWLRHTNPRVRVLSWLAIALWFPLGGCDSDRRIHIPGKDISIENPIQLPIGAFPYGASRDGSRIALFYPGPGRGGGFDLAIIDTDTQRELGRYRSKATSDSEPGTVIFSADARYVYLEDEGEYIRWDYQTQEKTLLGGPCPSVSVGISFGQPRGRWNSDRSLAMTVPYQQPSLLPDQAKRMYKFDGEIAVAGGKTHAIPYGSKCGFDMYGAAWFGKGKSWTRVDKTGEAKTFPEKPSYLTGDMSRDRGNLHLALTEREEVFKGARASVTCVWLYSDQATPFQGIIKGKGKDRIVNFKTSYRAAIVFAAVDLVECGFLPGRDMIYVVTGFGSYLVPFSAKPEKIHVMDESVSRD